MIDGLLATLFVTRTMDAVSTDVLRAAHEFDDARAWLEEARHGPMAPIAAEVWALDHDHRHVLLVRHRWRGLVPPGRALARGGRVRVPWG